MMNDVNEIIQWLQNWVYQKRKHIEICTLDNPGWGVRIDLEIEELEEKITLIDIEKTENDWYYCSIQNKRFEGGGGPYNFMDILSIFRQYISSFHIEEVESKILNMNDPIIWLQDWYFKQCNEDWEHCFGVTIETTEKGWHIKVDLIDTDLQGKILNSNLTIQKSEKDWISCSLKNEIFDGFCSSFNLMKTINIFRDWVGYQEL